MNARDLSNKSLSGEMLSREEAQAVLNWPEEDMLGLISETHKVRRKYFGKKIRLNFLANIKSGLCPEDCSYCSQSKDSKAPIDKYRLLSEDEILKMAERASANKAARLCLVASGRGPSDKDVDQVSKAVEHVRERFPKLEICVCMGLLKEGQAESLKQSGVDAYNHNLNTSERFYDDICSTHTHADRVDTVHKAQSAGLSACSGALFGMGESQDDILDVAYRLRELKAESIPVNFLIPIKGTPLSGKNDLTPTQCLRILCLFRLLSPASELRIAGGREVHLRSLQPLGLFIANSIFIGDYLTTTGQEPLADLEMIRDLGFEIVGDVPEQPPVDLSDRVTVLSRK